MELVGTFQFASLADLLLLLAASEQSGVLRFGGDSELWFTAGKISYATYEGAAPLRQALISRRVIDAAQWDEAVAAADGEGTGAALDALAGISRPRLREVVRERIVDTITPFLARQDVEYRFDAGQFHGFGPRCQIPVEIVIACVATRRRDWREIAASVPSLTGVPYLVDPTRGAAEDVWVLNHVGGVRTVREVIDHTGAGAYVVCCALDRLVRRGAVTIDDQAQALAG